jgi:hypothetical protein
MASGASQGAVTDKWRRPHTAAGFEGASMISYANVEKLRGMRAGRCCCRYTCRYRWTPPGCEALRPGPMTS